MTEAQSEKHIVSATDRDLEVIQARIMKMGGLVESAIMEVSEALVARDPERAKTVRDADGMVDRFEDIILEDTAMFIALRAPTAVDLRVVLTVMRISTNLERIGDYCKNIAKRSTVLVETPQLGDGAAALRRIAREVKLMLKDALDAYIQRDIALAEDVIVRDREVDQMYNALFRQFLTYMLEDPRSITTCMHLHFMAKNYERMGDHVTAIAEQVVYLATGERPDGQRPKADTTSVAKVEI